MTREELLHSLKSAIPYNEYSKDNKRYLPNSVATWKRIGEGDSFSEFGFNSNSEREEFLKDWISDNPYSNI